MTAVQTPRVLLHVGAPKTGSTFLQGVLWRNRLSLLDGGVALLGTEQADHYRAGKDIRGLPFDAADPGVDWTGAWDSIAAEARQSPTPTVILSDEHLASIAGDQAVRCVGSLRGREVHVVYVIRDLLGLLPSEWQEFVKHGSALSYADWVERLFNEPERRPGRWFWAVHDPVGVVGRWSMAVPLENIHVIWMPSGDLPVSELWQRFAHAASIDPSLALTFDVPGNPSLGYEATELLRRVNAALPSDFPRWHRTGLVRNVFANKVLNPLAGSTRPALSEQMRAIAEARADAVSQAVGALGCQVIGEGPLARDTSPQANEPALVTDAEMADLATQAIVGLLQVLASVRDDDARHTTMLREELDALRADADHQQRQSEEGAERRGPLARGPLARRLDVVRSRVYPAEGHSRVTSGMLDGYRRLRAGRD